MSKTPKMQLWEHASKHIYLIRGKRVMLDHDLAGLYGVQTKSLKRAVKRNRERFPEDFMFQLSAKEVRNLRCQIGTSSWGGTRYLPYAFTDYGILMLSSVLNSQRAVRANIHIMRAFMQLRELAASNELIRLKIDELERKYDKHDEKLKMILDALKALIAPADLPKKKPIGFHADYSDE